MINIADNYIYFYHLDKFCIIPMSPDQITDTMESHFALTNALSRSAPVFTYLNSGPRSVTMQIRVHRDILNEINKYNVSFLDRSDLKGNVVDTNVDDYAETLIRYLQSSALPKYVAYNASVSGVVPPMVAVRFGKLIFVKGVVTSGILVTYEKPVNKDGKYAIAYLNLTISEVDPYDAETVALVGSYRGIAAGNNIYNNS